MSIAAREARQKRSTVRLMPKPQPQPQPLPAPCRLFEVVDAEAEGLRPGAVFTALLGGRSTQTADVLRNGPFRAFPRSAMLRVGPYPLRAFLLFWLV